jgi:hypothetical protein
VRFQIEQRFNASPGEVLRALISAEYLHDGMSQLPDLSAPIVKQETNDRTVRNILVFSFGGRLPSVVTSTIDPKKLTWTEETLVDVASKTASFAITPEHYAHFFSCQGTWSVTGSGTSAARTINGEMKVRSPIPFVNGQVERAIVSGLRERLAKEPAILEAWLQGN